MIDVKNFNLFRLRSGLLLCTPTTGQVESIYESVTDTRYLRFKLDECVVLAEGSDSRGQSGLTAIKASTHISFGFSSVLVVREDYIVELGNTVNLALLDIVKKALSPLVQASAADISRFRK
jgi:hypothetical protein